MPELSLAQQVALLPPSDREEVLADIDPDDLQWDPHFWLRPTQLRPIVDQDWELCIFSAGRGSGKTRTMSEWVRNKSKTRPGSRGALIARTAADVRDVLVNGDSGILAVSPPSERPEWEPSKRLLTWPNGTMALCFSSEAPDQLRGPQSEWSAADEVASWKSLPDDSGLNMWDNVRLATRLGVHPQIMAATTPKRTQFMKQLLKAAEEEAHVLLLRGRTVDNAGNLAKTYLDTIYGLYRGTALARQELDGEMLDDLEGALWDEASLDASRVEFVTRLRRPLVVVGVDPAVAERGGDETGIIVAATDGAIRELHRRHVFVLEDNSLHAPPSVWASVVAQTARRWGAPVVVETNQGGALIRSALMGVDPTIKVIDVHSKQGKVLRAEPVVMAYQQGRVHHVGYLADLEDQQCNWVPDETRKSPDRVDALVHALTALIVKPPQGLLGGRVRAYSSAHRSLPPPPRPSARRSGMQANQRARVY